MGENTNSAGVPPAQCNTENDANLNVAKGLFTITVIFKGADRSQLSASEADAQAANYK